MIKHNIYHLFACILFVFFIVKAATPASYRKERTYEFKNHKLVLQYADENKKVEALEDELLQLLSSFIEGYEALYNITLPQTIYIVIHKEDLSRGAYAFAKKDTIDIYKIFGGKSLTIFDHFMLSHELGHIVMGSSDDRTLNETWATHLEYQLLRNLYKQSGKKFPRSLFNQPLTGAWKNDDYFKLLEGLEEKYGHKVIGKILKDISQKYLTSNRSVPVTFIKEAFKRHLKDDVFSEEYDRLEGVYFYEFFVYLRGKTSNEKSCKISVDVKFSKLMAKPLEQDDCILSVNGQSVVNLKDFTQKLQQLAKAILPSGTFTLEVQRQDSKQVLTYSGIDLLAEKPDELFKRKALKTWDKKEGQFLVLHYKNIPENDVLEIFHVTEAILQARKTAFNIAHKHKINIYMEHFDFTKAKHLSTYSPRQMNFYYGLSDKMLEIFHDPAASQSSLAILPHIGFPQMLASIDIGYADYSLLNTWLQILVVKCILPELQQKFGYTWMNEKSFGNFERTTGNPKIKAIWQEEEAIAENIFKQIETAHGNKIIGNIFRKLNGKDISLQNPDAFKEIRKAFEETLKDSRITALFDQLEALRLKKLKDFNLYF